MNNQPFSVPRRWQMPLRSLLAALLLGELLAWWLLRTSERLGLGWQFWMVVVATAAIAVLVASRSLWLVRHRFQFGLRTLLVSVMLVGTVLGIIGIRLRQTEKQRRAAAALNAIGAGVSYAGEDTPGLATFLGRQYFQEPVDVGFVGALSQDDLSNINALTGLKSLALCNSALADADLVQLSGLQQLRHIALVGTRVTGAGLEHLATMSQLNNLDLCRSPIDDSGLKAVSRFKTLVWLNLNQTPITDAGLAHLAGLDQLAELLLDRTAITGNGFVHLRSLRNLQQISLDRSRIGNDGLQYLQELPHLVSLTLSNTSIDDDGIESLSHMSGLRNLRLSGTGVSAEGLQRLRHALPNCVITHSSF